MGMTGNAFELRSASLRDTVELARLTTELGYPATATAMAPRLTAWLGDSSRQVFVAADRDRLLGWIGVERRITLENGDKAEIVGLVVDAGARRLGVGKALIEAAEAWVRERGLDAVMVRSNAARVESHPFYEGIGYVRGKTQHVYFKTLD